MSNASTAWILCIVILWVANYQSAQRKQLQTEANEDTELATRDLLTNCPKHRATLYIDSSPSRFLMIQSFSIRVWKLSVACKKYHVEVPEPSLPAVLSTSWLASTPWCHPQVDVLASSGSYTYHIVHVRSIQTKNDEIMCWYQYEQNSTTLLYKQLENITTVRIWSQETWPMSGWASWIRKNFPKFCREILRNYVI